MSNINDAAMRNKMEWCRELIEERLHELLTVAGLNYATLVEAMRYSLLSGGKRVRGVLCMMFCKASGGKPENALDAACAIEILHTYSLIHDDLPQMDGADLRRSKPSNHIEFGEFTAILAGDALQALAFETLSSSDLPSDAVVEMVSILAHAAGPHGICGGQYLDLSGQGWQLTIDELLDLYLMKTAALISAATRLGVIAAGGTADQVAAADIYAQAIGLAFQIRDDVLDVTSSEEQLGKSAARDIDNNKSTFALLLGVDTCEKMIDKKTEKAIRALDGQFRDPEFLIWMAKSLSRRKH